MYYNGSMKDRYLEIEVCLFCLAVRWCAFFGWSTGEGQFLYGQSYRLKTILVYRVGCYQASNNSSPNKGWYKIVAQSPPLASAALLLWCQALALTKECFVSCFLWKKYFNFKYKLLNNQYDQFSKFNLCGTFY